MSPLRGLALGRAVVLCFQVGRRLFFRILWSDSCLFHSFLPREI